MSGFPVILDELRGGERSKFLHLTWPEENTVSIVIPAGRNLKAVRNVIFLLCGEPYHEIIVVVNGSPNPLEINDDWENVHVLHEIHPLGASAARNKGVRHATGEIILFLDDDVIPEPGLVSAHLECYQMQDIVAVAGAVKLVDGDLKPSVLLDKNPLLYSFGAAETSEKMLWGVAANFSIRTSVFRKIEFSECFPKNGGGEDVFLGLSTHPYGEIAAAASAVVFHPQWESKRDTLGC